MTINIPKQLPNGATILSICEDAGGGVVLADNGPATSSEFVTWQYRPGDLKSTYWGHYGSDNLIRARTDYVLRIAQHLGVSVDMMKRQLNGEILP